MPNLDLKLDISRIKAEQRDKEEKKRKEEEHQQLQSRMRHTKRPASQSTSQVVIDDAIAKIVLKPLTSGTQAPSSVNRQQRPLSKQEQVSVSQYKKPIRGASSEVLGDTPSSPKHSVSGPGSTIKENIAQLRLLLQKLFQNTSTNKKLQQQKEAALQEALKKRAAAEEEEQRKQSRRF